MGRSCFILHCKANSWRGSVDPNNKLPSFFRFPKSLSLLEQWKKVIPPRKFNPRDPTVRDYLCSLHFNKNDVIKYFETHRIKGCPKTQIDKIERGNWALKSGAIPRYFNNDNPDAKCLVRGVQRRATRSSCERDSQSETKEATSEETFQDAEAVHIRKIILSREFVETETRAVVNELEMDLSQDIPCSFAESARLDHCYHLPLEQATVMSQSNDSCPPKIPPEPSTSGTITNIPGSLEQPSRNARSNTTKGKLKYDPYTIEQLHQDVLEIVLPKNWTFFQNDEDYSTEFIFYDKDMSVKSIKFSGSCYPTVTIRDSVMQHHRVNSRRDIEELIIFVSVL